jgi:hypothetical protein
LLDQIHIKQRASETVLKSAALELLPTVQPSVAKRFHRIYIRPSLFFVHRQPKQSFATKSIELGVYQAIGTLGPCAMCWPCWGVSACFDHN